MPRRGNQGGVVSSSGTASWTMDGVERPWQGQTSIYEQLVAQAERSSGVLPISRGTTEQAVGCGGSTALAASVVTCEVASALAALLERASSVHLEALDRLLTRRGVWGVVHQACLSDVVKAKASAGRVRALGQVLAREAPHLA